jgi:hypothetical protein
MRCKEKFERVSDLTKWILPKQFSTKAFLKIHLKSVFRSQNLDKLKRFHSVTKGSYIFIRDYPSSQFNQDTTAINSSPLISIPPDIKIETK